MNRCICIHGHFYQPPRENPWLESVELQDSAYPHHDWNKRITAECYAPNSASRILDEGGGIVDLVNNYAKISFNFGPTLLSWMEKNEPELYRSILEADKESQKRFSGHGSALAQTYNHMIMPLANFRDKQTQVVWGIRDFEHRFGRKPEGMWLAETAVDLETLDIMAEHEIKFTILAPRQAHRVRPVGENDWHDVSGENIDPKLPYLCRLPSGRSITLFFYDGPISREVAFSGILKSGEAFANRLMGAFRGDGGNQLVHIATDGETYGHHRRHGDMALAYSLFHIETNNLAVLTIYGEYLEKHPPKHEVEIYENSSWSCVHGVERWRKDCGCNSGTKPGWNQAWRAFLRGAMDWLRDSLARIYEDSMRQLVPDPWQCREDYIDVVLDRSTCNIESFLSKCGAGESSSIDKVRALKLLEMQRHAMLMYTSCGWFFDEISGIETVQVTRYAARAIQLAKQVAGINLEPAFIKILERAPSNIADLKNGAAVYDKFVKPAVLDLMRVGAHFAISSLFQRHPDSLQVYCYAAQSSDYERHELGRRKLALGKVGIKSGITLEESAVSFAVLHLDAHNFVGAVRQYRANEPWEESHRKIRESFIRNDIPSVLAAMDEYYKSHDFSLWHLFKDEKRQIMDQIMDATLKDVELNYRQVFDHYYPLMQAMREMNIPLPRVLLTTVEFILNNKLIDLLKSGQVDRAELANTIEGINLWSAPVEKPTIGYLAAAKIDALMRELADTPAGETSALLEEINAIFGAVQDLEVDLNLWKSQNMYFSLTKGIYREMKNKADQNDPSARQWVENFLLLGNFLRKRIQQ